MKIRLYVICSTLFLLILTFQNCGSFDPIGTSSSFDTDVPEDGLPQLKISGNKLEFWTNDYQMNSWVKVDAKSLERVSGRLAVDKDYVYCSGRKVEYIDRNSFRYAGWETFFFDKNGFYNCWTKLLPHNRVELSSTVKELYRDLNTGEIYHGRYFVTYDWNTFRPLSSNYYIDKDYIYRGYGDIIDQNKGQRVRVEGNLLYINDKPLFGSREFPMKKGETLNPAIGNTQYRAIGNEVYLGNYFILGIRPSEIRGSVGREFLLTEDKVYRNSVEVKDMDPSTFKRLNSQFYADADTIYLQSAKMEGVDPEGAKRAFSFHNAIMVNSRNRVFNTAASKLQIFMNELELVGEFYAKHDGNVYILPYFGLVRDADASTFELLEQNSKFARDATQVFYNTGVLTDADPSTFEVLNSVMGKDANNIYHGARIITPVLPNTEIEWLDGRHWKYGDKVFEGNKELEDVDAATFEIIREGYAVDANRIYFKGRVFEHSNPKSAVTIGNEGIILEDRVFYNYRHLAVDNPGGFRLIKKHEYNDAFWRDVDTLYLGREEIEGADPDNYSIVGMNFKENQFVIRSNGKLFDGPNEIPTTDINSFEYLGHGYISSGGQVFYQGILLENVNPDQFESTHVRGYFTDGQNYYLGSQLYFPNTGPLIKHRGDLMQVGDSFYLRSHLVDFPFTLDEYENLDNLYERIGNRIFWTGVEIPGVDAATFEVTGYGRAQDANQCYSRQNIINCN